MLVQLIDQPQTVNADETMVDWKVRLVESGEETPNVPRAELYRTRYAGVLRVICKSFRHGESVWMSCWSAFQSLHSIDC